MAKKTPAVDGTEVEEIVPSLPVPSGQYVTVLALDNLEGRAMKGDVITIPQPLFDVYEPLGLVQRYEGESGPTLVTYIED